MESKLLIQIDRLSDDELCAELKRHVRCEQSIAASVVAHLAGFQERRLYLGEGYSSAFDFCIQALGLSESAAYNRIMVAKVVRKFPVILDMLARSEVNLTAARLLAPHLTPENHRGLLEEARGKRKIQVLEIVARVAPKPPVPTSIRKLPSPEPPSASASNLESQETAARQVGVLATKLSDAAHSPQVQNSSAGSAHRPAVIAPLAPELYKFQFTGKPGSYSKLCRLQDLLRHQIPDGDPAEIIDRALSSLLRETEKKQLAATDRPRASRGVAPGSRDIPAAVKRVVWKRDGGQCAFIAVNGHRCTARSPLQFHHADPHGDGGQPVVENIELRCRAHNLYEGELYFGPFRAPPRKSPDQDPGPDPVVRETPASYSIPARGRWRHHARQRIALVRADFAVPEQLVRDSRRRAGAVNRGGLRLASSMIRLQRNRALRLWRLIRNSDAVAKGAALEWTNCVDREERYSVRSWP